MRYRAEIDGLRAVAVIPVILFHAGFESFSGGYVGVDIFFVISGYLITSIIWKDMGEGKFSLVKFYERRARRILPALFFVMSVCIPFAWIWLQPRDMRDFSQSIAAVSTFSSNILFWLESGYFDAEAELKPLLHTWSLAVEEQYYILFPLFLMITQRLNTIWIIAILGIITLLSFSMAHWGAYNNPSASFYLLPMRGGEILLGAFVAFYLMNRNSFIEVALVNQFVSLIGLSLIIYAVFAFNRETPFPSIYTLIPTIGAVLVILFTSDKTLVFRLLSNPVMVGIGLISYSAYLWHQPLLAFSKYRELNEISSIEASILCIVTLPMAYLSWRFIEIPFRNRQVIPTNVLWITAVVMFILLLSFGIAGHLSDGFVNRNVGIKALLYEPDNRKLQEESWNFLRSISMDKNYRVEKSPFDKLLWFDLNDKRTQMLLVGNSHSKDLFNDLYYSDDAKRYFQIARYGAQLRALVNSNHEFYDTPNYKNSQLVVLVTKYSQSDVDALSSIISHVKQDNKHVIVAKNIFEFRDFGWANLADYEISKIESTLDLAEQSDQVAKIINTKYYKEYNNNISGDIRFLGYNAEIEIIGKKMNVPVLDRMDYICSDADMICYAIGEKLKKYFFDYGHHTLEGAKIFGARVDSIGWLDEIIYRR